MCAPLTVRLWCGMPGVRTARRVLVSDHASCGCLACWPILSDLQYNDHLTVRAWRKLEHIRCMLLILTVGYLRPWGLVADCFQQVEGIGYVVVDVVGIGL